MPQPPGCSEDPERNMATPRPSRRQEWDNDGRRDSRDRGDRDWDRDSQDRRDRDWDRDLHREYDLQDRERARKFLGGRERDGTRDREPMSGEEHMRQSVFSAPFGEGAKAAQAAPKAGRANVTQEEWDAVQERMAILMRQQVG